MKMRKVTSLTALTSFVLLVATSVVLYVVPQGRVAYWADWRLGGMTKTAWGNVHINMGVLFLVSVFLHIYYNWAAITGYLKNRARKMRVFTPEFNAALAATAVVTAGTVFLVPPFSWVIDAETAIKDAAAVKYGEPPYGHAELSSLKTFAARMDIDPDKAAATLKANGIRLDNDRQSLQDIAAANGISPQQIYLAIKPAEIPAATTAPRTLPESPPAGIGRLALAEITRTYGLDIGQVMGRLRAEGLDIDPDLTLREIAAANRLAPEDVYRMLKISAAG